MAAKPTPNGSATGTATPATLPSYEESEKGSLELSRNGSLFDPEAAVPATEKGQVTRGLRGFGASLGGITILGLILISIFAHNPTELGDQHVTQYYQLLSNVLIMVYVGFGFLMTFLKRYSLSAVSLNFILSALMTTIAIPVMGWVHNGFGKFELDLPLLVDATFCAAAGMITFGAVIGFATPSQLAWLLFFETILYAVNVYVTVHLLGTLDTGGSITIHAFGAFFGLAASVVLSRTSKTPGSNHPKNSSSRRSDLTSMIGTIFLWIYWPSFNAALASNPGAAIESQHQLFVISNTLLSLLGATLATFSLSTLLTSSLDMVAIQNATLAGGVAIGSSAALNIAPGAALGVGIIAGLLSTLGFSYSTAFFEKAIGMSDTCGVQNLHGMPGALGAIVSAILIAVYPTANAELYEHESGKQAGYQIAGLAATVGIAVVGGLLGGLVVGKVNVPVLGGGEVVEGEMYEDAVLVKGD